MTIGEKIRILRTSLNLTQEELADAVGTRKQTIHKYETGVISNIPASKIKSIADKLETTPAYLMGWTDLSTPEAKTNDIISDIFVRLRRDPDFLDLTSTLYSLPAEKLPAVKTVLEAFKP